MAVIPSQFYTNSVAGNVQGQADTSLDTNLYGFQPNLDSKVPIEYQPLLSALNQNPGARFPLNTPYFGRPQMDFSFLFRGMQNVPSNFPYPGTSPTRRLPVFGQNFYSPFGGYRSLPNPFAMAPFGGNPYLSGFRPQPLGKPPSAQVNPAAETAAPSTGAPFVAPSLRADRSITSSGPYSRRSREAFAADVPAPGNASPSIPAPVNPDIPAPAFDPSPTIDWYERSWSPTAGNLSFRNNPPQFVGAPANNYQQFLTTQANQQRPPRDPYRAYLTSIYGAGGY